MIDFFFLLIEKTGIEKLVETENFSIPVSYTHLTLPTTPYV